MNSVINKSHTVDDLSALFDHVDAGSNLDKSLDSNDVIRPFSSICNDVSSTMESEAKIEPTTQIESAPAPEKSLENESFDLISEPEFENDDINKEAKEDPLIENPLGLSGENLKAYEDILKRYPQFVLYDGSQAFKDFYRYKVIVLKSLLTSFAVLDLGDMRTELENISVKHQIGDDVASPELIQKKLDECFSCRPRLNTLLAQAHNQSPAWKKSSEMLSAKLWKDHESKGAHKRLALDLEHMYDMSLYVANLQGFIDAASIIDGILKSAGDSLSRQLACVNMRLSSGNAYQQVVDSVQESVKDSVLDDLDVIKSGVVINKPSTVSSLSERDFGGDELDSFLNDIG